MTYKLSDLKRINARIAKLEQAGSLRRVKVKLASGDAIGDAIELRKIAITIADNVEKPRRPFNHKVLRGVGGARQLSFIQLRELSQIAQELDLALCVKFSGSLYVGPITSSARGHVLFETELEFTTDSSDPSDVGWEHFNEKLIESLRFDCFVTTDGDTLTLKEVMARRRTDLRALRTAGV